jgi:hypothetical protein
MARAIPLSDDPNFLRHVILRAPGGRYDLRIWDSGRTDHMGKTILRYEFRDPRGYMLFSGSDFGCSPMDAIDSDETIGALLGFLTLRPGDTDREYFASYTRDQMAFAESSDAEYLQMYVYERFDREGRRERWRYR